MAKETIHKTRVHYTEPYLLNPQHRVTVDLVGMGGTGSQVLSKLVLMDISLRALGHPGLHVRGWDPDVVSAANIGRQLFFEPEIGQYKANCIITRVNRGFGLDWEAWPMAYGQDLVVKENERLVSNILISCVDTIKSRVSLAQIADAAGKKTSHHPYERLFYWLDFGNAQKTGQVVLGTTRKIEQPKKVPKELEAVPELPHVLQMFPELKKQKESASGPSCSLAEALTQQDLFINPTLCDHGMGILWKLFRDLRIAQRGCFVNTATVTVNPINV